jgi:REP element-mobilizing transposase RayT
MDLFRDNNDHYKFLSILQDVKDLHGFWLYSYCLMKNHAHLLIQEDKIEIPKIMKSVCIRFAIYFNQKYDRVGHVFQDRFKSELIDGETYFIVCARYIHRNPLKAGIVSDLASYRWSSYPAYATPRSYDELVDKKFLYEIFSANPEEAVASLKEFTEITPQQEEEPVFIDIDDKPDNILHIQRILGKHGLTIPAFKKVSRKLRRSILIEILNSTSISERKLASLLNISRPAIAKAKEDSSK